jgi:hypothetical protein
MCVKHYILKIFSLAALILGKCTLNIHPSCLKDCLLERNSVLKMATMSMGKGRLQYVCVWWIKIYIFAKHNLSAKTSYTLQYF